MTKKKAQIGYEFLDASGNFIYEARETGKTHTPFASEILLFQSIKCGDLTGVKNALNLYRQSGLIIGHMSDNPSRKIHYWAVSTIAVAIHYAILGGLDESEAYQLSDFYIQKIDSLQTMEECIDYLCEKAIELVTKVKEKSIPQCYSPLINQCVHLIHIHLHSRLKIEDIAKSLHVIKGLSIAGLQKGDWSSPPPIYSGSKNGRSKTYAYPRDDDQRRQLYALLLQ